MEDALSFVLSQISGVVPSLTYFMLTGSSDPLDLLNFLSHVSLLSSLWLDSSLEDDVPSHAVPLPNLPSLTDFVGPPGYIIHLLSNRGLPKLKSLGIAFEGPPDTQ